MQIDIEVPQLGESVTEATVSAWLKQQGDAVSEGDVLCELETDKVMVEVPAPRAGVLTEVLKPEGETVGVGDVLGRIDTEGAGAQPAAEQPAAAPEPSQAAEQPAQAAAPQAPQAEQPAGERRETLSPAVRRMVEENNLDPAQIPGTGRGGQLTKEDVVRYLERQGASGAPAEQAGQEPTAQRPPGAQPVPQGRTEPRPTAGEEARQAPSRREPAPQQPRELGAREERVHMSRLRQRIAERLKDAQNTAAMLTTFNEVDMSGVMDLRNRYKDLFREKHGSALGFMSVFTKACIQALREFPQVNAEVDGSDIIYKNYYDIGIAVGTERGLVVPVVRDADRKSFIQIEQEIAELAGRARDGKLTVDDLTGGTFSITNGGIYGSMLSTPILNPPQSGILGMHNIVKRAVVVNDEIVVRPMMYVALSYDHRIVDGREAVQFLVRVKECVEDPARLLLEI